MAVRRRLARWLLDGLLDLGLLDLGLRGVGQSFEGDRPIGVGLGEP